MKMIQRIAIAFFAFALTATAGVLAAPPVATLTLPAPFGSSPVLAWSWGASSSGTTHIGGGGGAGKANIQDLAVTRATDKQSPLFFGAVTDGTILTSVVLSSGSMSITLENVLVVSYSTGASDKTQTDNISLNFSKVTYSVGGVADGWEVEP